MTSIRKDINRVPRKNVNLLYKGEEVFMPNDPLSDYLKTRNENGFEPPSKEQYYFYVGRWKIENNKLYLIGLEVITHKFEVVGPGYFFPGQEIVFAEWYTGTLIVARGEMLEFYYSEDLSFYEWSLLLKFENGLLVEEYERDNREFLRKRNEERELKRKEDKRLRKVQIKENRIIFLKKLFGIKQANSNKTVKFISSYKTTK